MIDFWWITVLKLSFEKFLRNSLEFFHKKFLRISPEYFSWDFYVCGFLGEFIKRISFKTFLGISLEFHPRKS